jgi:outer membrane protein insertion porin family
MAATSRYRVRTARVPLAVALIGLVAVVSGLASPVLAERFDRIDVVGTRRIDPDAAISQAGIKTGELSSEAIANAIKALYKTGFFAQVSAAAKNSGNARVLELKVVEKPQVRKVFIVGNEAISEDDLKDVFNLGTNRFLDRTRIAFLIRTAVSYYQSKGYLDASFDYSVVPVEDNQVDLTLTVSEGVAYKIREIEFKGLSLMDEDDLSAAIQTSRYKWWSSWITGTGRLNKEMLENDKSLARQALLDNGFLEGSLSEPEIEARDGDIKVTFYVDEGRQYRVDEISTSGDALDLGGNPLENIETAKGEVFSASKARADSFKVSDKFADEGYAFANVIPETRVNKELGLVSLDYRVAKGKKVSVDEIKLRGNEKTYDNVIRRELKLAEQDEFSGTKLKRSQKLLERLGYFDEVSITTEPTSADDKVNLLVNVKEGQTGRFSIGAGFSSADGVLFNTRLSENNLLGTGRSATLDLDLGTERNNVNLSFQDPRINDTYWSGTATGLRNYRRYTDFDRVLTGGSVEAAYPLEEVFGESLEDFSFGLQYQLLNVSIKDVDKTGSAPLVIASEGDTVSSSFIPRLTRNTINNPLDPKEGSRQNFSIEYAGVGGDNEFWVAELKNLWFYPFLETSAGPLVFSMRTSYSHGDSLDDDPFPLYRRFFPGGINSVRGYKNRRLGPVDERGNQYGGAKEFVNNAEVIFPIVKSAGLKGVVFYDVGQAFDDNDSLDLGELRKAWGYGLRWTSPLGPIRIEFGVPIGKKDGESKLVTMFAFGAPF